MRHSLFQSICYKPAQSLFCTAKWLLVGVISLVGNAKTMMAEHANISLLQKVSEIEEESRPSPLEHYISAAMIGYVGGLIVSGASYFIVKRAIQMKPNLVKSLGMAFRGDILATFIITSTITGLAIALNTGLIPVGVINLGVGMLLIGPSVNYWWRYRREQNNLMATDSRASAYGAIRQNQRSRGSVLIMPADPESGQPAIYEAGDEDESARFAAGFTL